MDILHNWIRAILVTICALALSVTSALAQSAAPLPAYRNRLLGVYDGQTGDPIEGAQVTDAMNKVSALTTKTGTITLVFLPEGGSVIRIQKLGYQPATILALISPADTVPLTVTLSPAAQALPAVITTDSSPHYVSPGLKSFEERRRSNVGGHFITEAELRKHDSEKVTGLVRGFPGLSISCSRVGVYVCIPTSTRQASKHALSGGPCPPEIWLDGSPYMDNDLERLNVNQLAAIEYYAGSAAVPPQFNRTGSSCGVLIFWTRER